jgi:hypothetical protein
MLFRDIHFTCEGPQSFRFYFAFYVNYALAISPYLRSLPNGKYKDAVIQNRGITVCLYCSGGGGIFYEHFR